MFLIHIYISFMLLSTYFIVLIVTIVIVNTNKIIPINNVCRSMTEDFADAEIHFNILLSEIGCKIAINILHNNLFQILAHS